MKPEISQLCSQKPATSRYHKADKIRPDSPVLVLEDRLLTFHLFFGLSSRSFPSGFVTKAPYALTCRSKQKNQHYILSETAYNSF
jgi:hypothetical protein